jgi:predicted RNA-binding Zn-ribbon protein involved in translation (DUF1610 family)
MPICPKCGKEINKLINWRREYSEYYIYFAKEEDEYPIWERVDVIEDDDSDEGYECPSCGALLFKTYKDAVAFLKQQKTLEKAK